MIKIFYIILLLSLNSKVEIIGKFNIKNVKIIQEEIEIEDFYDKKSKKFVNTKVIDSKTFFDVIKWKMNSKSAEWPENVPNQFHYNNPEKIDSNQVAVTFINHSSFLLQLDKFNILTDPVFSKRVSPISWAGPKRVRKSGIDIDSLPYIDIVIISHNHYDHLDINSLVILKEKFNPLFLIPIGDGKILKNKNITNYVELHWWQTAILNSEFKITFTPAQHFSNRGLFDRDKSQWGSYMINYNNQNIYFGGDTGYSPHFKKIAKHFKTINLSFIPIGAYEPRYFMRDVHVNPDDAVQAHLDLNSQMSIGMHFGTFQLTDESINEPIYDLKLALKKYKVESDKFITLEVGKTTIFNLK